MKKLTLSKEHTLFLKKNKRKNVLTHVIRLSIIVIFLFLWELLARLNVIDSFISSSPSKIMVTIKNLIVKDNLFYHIKITLYETILGFLIAVIGGYLIALILWWSETLKRVFDPFLVVLNSLPKIALGPIIIVWFGSGEKAIIFMAVLVGIIVAVITMLIAKLIK